MFPKMHEIERRTRQAAPSTHRASRPKAFLHKPNAVRVYESEYEQERDATEEEDIPEVELSVEEYENLEDTAQDHSDGEDAVVGGAHHAGWRASQKTADIRKGIQETSLTPRTTSGGK